MTNVYGSLSMAFRDYRGRSARVNLWLTDATETALAATAASVGTAIAACSNAVNTSESGLVVAKAGTAVWGAAAAYADCGQKLTIIGLASDGRLHRLSIPAPLLTDFLADETTMNIGDTNVAALLTLLDAHWVSADDDKSPITVIDGGFRDRSRKTRIGAWSRSATGTSLQP